MDIGQNGRESTSDRFAPGRDRSLTLRAIERLVDTARLVLESASCACLHDRRT